MIFFIDTSFDITTIAIKKDEKFYKEIIDVNTNISQVLVERTKIILKKSKSRKKDIKKIVFNQGPGNFTSLRIALAYIKAMAFHLNIPVVTLNSFQIMALSSIKNQSKHPFFVAIDARMNEIYVSEYKNYLDIYTKNKNYYLLSTSKCYEKLKYFKSEKATLIKNSSDILKDTKNHNSSLKEVIFKPNNVVLKNIFHTIEKKLYFSEKSINQISLLYIRDNVAQKQK